MDRLDIKLLSVIKEENQVLEIEVDIEEDLPHLHLLEVDPEIKKNIEKKKEIDLNLEIKKKKIKKTEKNPIPPATQGLFLVKNLLNLQNLGLDLDLSPQIDFYLFFYNNINAINYENAYFFY